MESSRSPIGSNDPYDKYRVEGIEGRLPPRQDGGGGDEPPDEKWAIAAYLLGLLKKTLDLFHSSAEKTEPKTAEKKAYDHLTHFRDTLAILKGEDRSQDIQFLNELSRCWHLILEDSLKFKRDAAISAAYKALIKKIEAYPQMEVHTLGYYLTEYAGQKWIPFPFMELVQKIHTEYENTLGHGNLTDWIRSIDALTPLLQVE